MSVVSPGSMPSRRAVRVRVGDILSGTARRGSEVDIVTGFGDDDCGFPFQVGEEYFLYADRDQRGQLRTSSCTRTRRLAEAGEDMAYLRAKAGMPETSRLAVRTAYPGHRPQVGISIVLRSGEKRWTAVTNAVGDAVFSDLPPGSYRIHSDTGEDLTSGRTVRLGARGEAEFTVLR